MSHAEDLIRSDDILRVKVGINVSRPEWQTCFKVWPRHYIMYVHHSDSARCCGWLRARYIKWLMA